MSARPPRAALLALSRGFTLVELVLAVAIIGILAAIALPRLSRGSDRANIAATARDLTTLQRAIERYAVEHDNRYPGANGGDVAAQLTQYTDVDGVVSDVRTARYRYGPYLTNIPPNRRRAFAAPRDIAIDTTNSPPRADVGSDAGWVYNPVTGEILGNNRPLSGEATEADIVGDVGNVSPTPSPG